MKHLLGFALIVFIACNSTPKPEGQQLSSELKYAKGFSMKTEGSKTFVEVYNPWSNYSVLARYELVQQGDTSTGENTIEVPIKSLSSLSSTYLGMLALLNARDQIISSSSANWIYDSVLYARFKEGAIHNLGNDLTISPEAVIAHKPDVVLKYIYQSPDPVDPIIAKSGVSIVYIIEFMEEHPLGRAEWIKFLGALTGKQREADSAFKVIESNYLKYKQLATQSHHKPEVLDGTIYKGTWYAAGGNSFMAKLLKDANAHYFWFTNNSTGSLPLSFESVIQRQGQADFWINANANSLEELLAIESRVEVFKAFKEKKVYHYNKRENENGGLDYYESGVARPDLLLRDLLIILHPDLIQEETVYYKQLD
jgi:iron complex transport system substrate-binding protein